MAKSNRSAGTDTKDAGITLTTEQIEELERSLGDIVLNFAAIRRLAMETDGRTGEDDLDTAAQIAITSLANTGGMMTDALLQRVLGLIGVGSFDEELARLTPSVAPARGAASAA